MSQSYAADVALEPVIWIVDNYAHFLGRVSVEFLLPKAQYSLLSPSQFFVVGVATLTSAVVYIAHRIGLPYWWEKSPAFTAFLVLVGYWLLINVIFHYFMAVNTEPGYPPDVS